MGFYQTVAYTTTGTKASLNVDPHVNDFKVSVAVTLASTGTYKLQYSLDPMTVADADALWFDDANLAAGTAASGTTNYMFPVARIRIVIAAVGSTITLQIRQGGIGS